jgi:hypothetical protein
VNVCDGDCGVRMEEIAGGEKEIKMQEKAPMEEGGGNMNTTG